MLSSHSLVPVGRLVRLVLDSIVRLVWFGGGRRTTAVRMRSLVPPHAHRRVNKCFYVICEHVLLIMRFKGQDIAFGSRPRPVAGASGWALPVRRRRRQASLYIQALASSPVHQRRPVDWGRRDACARCGRGTHHGPACQFGASSGLVGQRVPPSQLAVLAAVLKAWYASTCQKRIFFRSINPRMWTS